MTSLAAETGQYSTLEVSVAALQLITATLVVALAATAAAQATSAVTVTVSVKHFATRSAKVRAPQERFHNDLADFECERQTTFQLTTIVGLSSLTM